MKKTFVLIPLLFLTTLITAQVKKSSELYKTIKEKDSLLFTIGFNHCDINQFKKLVSANFEFYHDQAGITNSKSDFIQGIKEGLCKLAYKPKRILAENSLKVFPLKNNGILYGAIQTGEHHFYAIKKNKEEYLTSIAKFTHLWILEKGNWKLSRVLSFNHKDVDKEILFKDKNITERWLKKKNIPAVAIGYIENGKIKQLSVFGELEKGKTAPKNTIWNVASLTKPIVTLLTLKLVNNGDWSLDEPVYHYWIDENINKKGDFAMVHGGDDIGVHTIVFMIPKTKQGLIIFTNSDNGTGAFQEILLKYLGKNGQGILKVEMK